MYRKYIENLSRWLNNPIRKPLVVWGSRQVGKTTLIRDLFAEQYFPKKYIYVDCLKDKRISSYISNHMNVEEILNFLSVEFDMTIDENVLLVFDEAQECLPIITMMKYFCQERREIPLIVTGSMVRIKLTRKAKINDEDQSFLFPTGKINQLTVYPLNFGEYLLNRNESFYSLICKAYQNKQPLEKEYHDKAINYFFDYLLLGGMPEVVDTFLKFHDYKKARDVLKDLYDNYLSDMSLYQETNDIIIRTRKTFDNIYSQLNKENKNFKCSQVESGKRNRDFNSPIEWLSFAYLVNKSYLQKETVTSPLRAEENGLYRLYLSDMGIFTYQSKENATYFFDENSRNILSGIYFENYVADELVYNGYDLYYWQGKGNAEFEFLLESNKKIYPIDVKKKRGTLNSLEKYRNHNSVDMVIKVSQNYYGYDETNKILTIPFYDFFLFLEEMKEQEI